MTINGDKKMLAYAVKYTNKLKKLDNGEDKDTLAGILLTAILHDKVNEKMTILVNASVRDKESKAKDEALHDAIIEGRNNGKIFYVASKHADSAEDHKDYQGLIYVDENYANFGDEIKEFVEKNKFNTLQWVIGEPVYFITRPYCRHYFVQYTYEQIKKHKYHIPNRKIGNRALQTPKGATREYYLNRLAMLEALYSKHPTWQLRDKILKIKILLQKYK